MDKLNTTQAPSEQQKRITTPPQAHPKSLSTRSAECTANSSEPQSQRPRATSLWKVSVTMSSSISENTSGFGKAATSNVPSKDGLWCPSNSTKVPVPKELVEAAEREVEVTIKHRKDEKELAKKQ